MIIYAQENAKQVLPISIMIKINHPIIHHSCFQEIILGTKDLMGTQKNYRGQRP